MLAYGGAVYRASGAVAAGGLLTLAFPRYGLWWLAPLAIALLTLITYAVRPRAGFGLGVLAGLGFFVPTLSWAGTDFLGVIPWLGLALLQSLYFGVLGAGSAWLQRLRIRPTPIALVWVAQEALRSRTPYGGFPWVKVAFSQADAPFGRLAALGGAPAVTFAVALAGGLIAAAGLAAYRSRSLPRWPTALALVVGVAGFAVPLPTDGRTAQVLAVQGNVPRAGLDFNAERRAVLDNHVEMTIRGAQAGRDAGLPAPDLVLWPENASDIDPTRNPDARDQITLAVDRAGAPILLGGLLYEPEPMISNAALLYLPQRGLVQVYVKQHPVPFAEYIPNKDFFRRLSASVDLIRSEMAAGDSPGIFTVPAASGARLTAGVSICFEVAYDDLVRANVTEGATLLVVQTNNATFGYSHESEQQLAISRLRAIEHGRSVVHVSTVGVSALILPDGTLRQPTALFTAAALADALPLREGLTLATRLGPWPEYLAVLVLLGLLVTAPRGGRKESSS